MDSPEHNIWYLAYGSNINHETFTGGRGIQPLDAVVVRVPGWKLTMDIGGTPYSEPAFSSIAPRTEKDGSHVMDVVGVAYLITAEQMLSVVGSEGGGITYSDILVRADVMDEKDSLRVGGQLMVRTLGTAFGRSPEGRPSKRYMSLICVGAMASKLPPDYCHFLNDIPTFQPLNTVRGKIGTALFLAFWGPVMVSMEKLTKSTLRKDGTVPTIVIYIVRLVIILMWCFHDYIHAPVWGRGDGLGGNAGSVAHADELAWLLGAEKC